MNRDLSGTFSGVREMLRRADMPPDSLDAEMNGAATAIEKFSEELAVARREYNGEGLRKWHERRVPTLQAALQPLEARRQLVERRIAEVRAQVLAPAARPKDPGDRIEQVLRDREVRDLLRGRDRLEVQGIYLAAVESGDADTVRAIEAAPAVGGLVDTATREKADAMRLKANGDYIKLGVSQQCIEWINMKIREVAGPMLAAPAPDAGRAA